MGTPIEPSEPVEAPVDNESSGINPAWNDVLSVLPEQFHENVTGHFKQWDEAANQRIESVNAQLKEFEAYKPFLEHGINPEELQQSLRVWYEVQNNPESVFNALRDAYGYGGAVTPEAKPGATGEEGEEDPFAAFDITQHPEYQKLQQNLQTVTEVVYNDVKAKEAAQADLALESEIKTLQTKYGEYNLPVPLDMDYVLTKMINGVDGEKAVEAFRDMVKATMPQPFAPNVMGTNSGAGTGLPSQAIDPTQLSGKETRNLVVEMIKNQMQNRG